MSKKNNLGDFFNKKKPKTVKKKDESEAVEEESKVEENLPKNDEFVESDDETANLDLIQATNGRTGVKDLKQIEQAKQDKMKAENEKSDWSKQLGGGQQESQPKPVKVKTAQATNVFDGTAFARGGAKGLGGPPKFTSNKSKVNVQGGINQSDFPQMGEFPTIGQEEQATTKKSEFSGSYQSMAKDSSASEKGSGISFSKGGPPVFTSKKKKVADPTQLATDVQGVQNYDFSKMNLAGATQKRVEGEEGQVETTQEDGTKVLLKKAPRQRQQTSESAFVDNDEFGFEKASDKRKVVGRGGQYEEEDEEEVPVGWNRNN